MVSGDNSATGEHVVLSDGNDTLELTAEQRAFKEEQVSKFRFEGIFGTSASPAAVAARRWAASSPIWTT